MTEQDVGAEPRKLVPISQPININSSDAAHLYTHLHPVLLLSLVAALYQFHFSALVDSTLWTLTWTIVPLALLQMLYCIICLPPSTGSSSSAQSNASKTPKKKRVQFAKPPATLASKVIVSFYHPFRGQL